MRKLPRGLNSMATIREKQYRQNAKLRIFMHLWEIWGCKNSQNVHKYMYV